MKVIFRGREREIRDRLARALVAMGKATLVAQSPIEAPRPPAEAEALEAIEARKAPKKKRAYKRRDLRAESE